MRTFLDDFICICEERGYVYRAFGVGALAHMYSFSG